MISYNKTSRRCKTEDAVSATVEQINDYSDKALKGLICCILSPCPRCGLESEYFKRHETRRRQFYVVLEQIVKVVTGLLIRWKCPGCNKTFTQYPEFALPYKRYTLPTIMDFCGRYTENENTTYRRVTVKMPLGYQNSEKQLEYSTIHRWITSLGSLKTTVAKSVDFILQANPLSSICRNIANLSIGSKKYRSFARKDMLISCRRLFQIEALYLKTFNISIFPNLATACRFA